MLFQRTTLRQMLTLPYVLLVLLAASTIGWLSYQAGSDAVDTLSDRVLYETVGRISQAVDKHVSGSEAVLETAFPADVPPPQSLEQDLEELRMRLWLATTIHRDPNNYAYYGNEQGHFIGLWRLSETEAELRLRTGSEGPRSLYRFSRILGPLRDPILEERVFDPRQRPWYKAGQRTASQTWTSIYIDFKTLELVGTRARRVNDEKGQFEGVVATDMSLQHLNNFLKTLTLTANGVAFIVENDGNLIATSRGAHVLSAADGSSERLNAVSSDDRLIPSTYKAVSELIRLPDARSGIQSTAFESSDGQTIQAGYARLQDAAGLDWIVGVAVPRQDFMHKVTRNVRRTAGLAVAACVLIIALGLYILNRIATDLQKLAHAARAMGEGDATASIPVERSDEIGELAKSFSHLQDRLLTDRLTGIANREAIIRRLEDRIIRHRRRNDAYPFAVLFIDLNTFKAINDRFGHEIGDQVLIEVAQRLTRCIRDMDVAARFGGDEFVVLLDKVDNRADLASIAENLQTELRKPYDTLQALTDEAIRFTHGGAIGQALYPEDGKDLESLLKCADDSMYATKARNRGWA